MGYYTSWRGLTNLSASAKGNETLGVGLRPYGLHAGNLASVVAYPYLFLENFEARRKENAYFTFQVWFNDLEPTVYVGANGRRQSANWANMYPGKGSTSFQLTPAPNGFEGNLVDYWQPAIEGVVRGTIEVRFPNVKLEFRRASELVGTPEFEKTVIGCIKNSDKVKRYINDWNNNVAEVKGPASFVWPLCPQCHDPLISPELSQVGDTDLISTSHKLTPTTIGKKLTHNAISQKPVRELFWAMQFRILHAARLAAIKPDIWFMGVDHLPTNMGNLMENLADAFGIARYRGNFLHAPLLFADGNKKLSKSLGNAVYMPVEELIRALRGNPNLGLDVKYAPVSSDILSIGPNLLPSYIVGDDQERRMAVIKRERDAYESSDKPVAFRSANLEGKIKNTAIARMVGTPHI